MLIIDTTHCLGCAGCIAVCPETALFFTLSSLYVDRDACSECGLCVRLCPMLALSLDNSKMPSRRARL